MDSIQYDKPIFVRSRHENITWKGTSWTYGQFIPWQEVGIPETTMQIYFNRGLVYHNEELEVQNKVGDRLSELNSEKLRSLVTQLNAVVKDRTSSKAEFNLKKCKQSKLDDKQRGLIRQWLNRNGWVTDDFYRIRDFILGED